MRMDRPLSLRHFAVLSLIALLPFGSGLLMLNPDDAVIQGLANITILLSAWPEIRADLRPRGRLTSARGAYGCPCPQAVRWP